MYDQDTMAGLSLREHHHHTAGAASAGAEEGGGYHNNGCVAVPSAVQVVDDEHRDGMVADASVAQDEVAGVVVGAERVPGGLGGIGLAATSLAVAGLTAGIAGVATSATALALFAALLGGVAVITVHVLRA